MGWMRGEDGMGGASLDGSGDVWSRSPGLIMAKLSPDRVRRQARRCGFVSLWPSTTPCKPAELSDGPHERGHGMKGAAGV